MAKIDLKTSVKNLGNFFTNLNIFGTRIKSSDQHIFDRRGAIQITDKEIKLRNGEIVKIRGIQDAGGGSSASSMVISRPSSGQSVDASKAMDAYHSWPYTAIKPIADEIAGIEWRVYKINSEGEKEEIVQHEIIDFLDAVNDFQTGPEFKHTLAVHLELTGNAYILLEGVTDETSKPTAMHLLDPGRVKINLDKTTYPFKIINYEFTFDSRKWIYQPYQILQIKYPDPSNPFIGIGTVQGIAEWIDNDTAATEFLKQFFNNGAQIGVTFETDMSGEDQLQELRDSFNEQHSGVKNAYKAIFLPKGVSKPVNDVKFDDIGFDETSDKNRDKILAGFRVPKTVLGANESETNRATAETADYVFARRTIKPKMILICSYFNEFLVPRFGDDIFLTFTDPVTEDKVAESTEMKNAIGSASVITPNEARRDYMDLEPVDGGDTLLIPNNLVPVADAGKTPAYQLSLASKVRSENNIHRKSKVGYMPVRVGKAKTQFARNAQLRKDMSKSLSAKIAEVVISVKNKKINEMTDEEYDSVILKEKRERIIPYAEKMKEEIKKLNERQKKEVLDNLSEALKSVKAVDPKKLFNYKGWINIFIDALTPIATDMFTKEADHALRLIDKPGLDIVNTPSAQTAIDHAMELMSESYNKTTIDALEAKLNEGLSQGFGVSKLGDLVSDVYAWNDTYAAERVALTESNRISNTAGKIAWKESGVVKQLRWATSQRDNVCVFCADMAGEIINIDDNFFEKGDTYVVDDQSLDMDYSAIGGPPLHPNCHCGMKPIVDTSIEAGIDNREAGEEILDAIIGDLEKEP